MHKKLAAMLLATTASGCFWATTKSEGESMRKDIKSLDDRVATKEKTLDEQIAQLQKVLDDATKVLKRNSADLGADVDALRNDVRAAVGSAQQVKTTLEELRAANDAAKKANDVRLDAIEQRLAQLESGKPAAGASADDLWRLGTTAFEAGRYNDAIEIYKRLTQTFPTHDKADDAVYFRGQSYVKLKDWEKAIGVFQTLLDKYPEGSLTDDGLYFAALAAQNLKQCSEARTYLNLIRTKYPKSNVLKEANDLDAALKKEAKNKAKCAS
ncbi:MAG: tetratricopeptide repeat protein [Deltaproteobacteria bacterium]|nr:tetratricopeptide repeat protein [Deltaproteobacteria bacterium]